MSFLSNAKWNSFSQIFKIFVQLINLIYLAKIISPDQYGVLAMATVVTNLGLLLRDLGTSSALIQRKNITRKLINSVFWLNVAIGIFLCLVISLSSPLVSIFYKNDQVTLVLISLSFIFPFSSFGAVYLALLERDSKFKIISIIEVVCSLISVVIAIILAMKGYGVYSLVAQSLIFNCLSAILFYKFSNWRPNFIVFISVEKIKDIFNYSANISFFNIVNYFSRNADNFFIGRAMSPTVLGNYSLAYRIMLFPLQSLTFVASRSLFPILSRNQNDLGALSKVYDTCVILIITITAPLMLTLSFYSKDLIPFFFGKQWLLTPGILHWLAPTAIIQSVLSTTGAVFMARDKTKLLFKLGLLGTILQVGSFIIGIQGDIFFFAKCYFIANVINFFPAMILVCKVMSASFVKLFLRFIPVFISSLAMLSFYIYFECVKYLFYSLNQFIFFSFPIAIGLIIYSLLLILIKFSIAKLSNKECK